MGQQPNQALHLTALLVFAELAPGAGRPVPRIPYEPFIAFLSSPVWTDRNKATGALMILSASRDAALIASLRKEALVPLVEMARWKSDDHAWPVIRMTPRRPRGIAVNANW